MDIEADIASVAREEDINALKSLATAAEYTRFLDSKMLPEATADDVSAMAALRSAIAA